MFSKTQKGPNQRLTVGGAEKSVVPESKPAELQPQPTYYNADNGGWNHKCHPLGESDSGIRPSLFKYSEMKSLQNVKGTHHIYFSFKIATNRCTILIILMEWENARNSENNVEICWGFSIT